MTGFCFVGGFGQTGEVLEPLSEEMDLRGGVTLTSVYELALSARDSCGALNGVFPPDGPSLYSHELRKLLVARERNILIGWSSGGMVALETACYFPEDIVGIVLLGCCASFVSRSDADGKACPGVPLANLRAMKFGLRKEKRGALKNFFSRVYQADFLADQLEAKLERGEGLDSEILLHNLDYLQRADLTEAAKASEIEALVVHGVNDRVVPVSAGAYLAERLGKVRPRFVADAGHGFCEETTGLVSPIIGEFFGR